LCLDICMLSQNKRGDRGTKARSLQTCRVHYQKERSECTNIWKNIIRHKAEGALSWPLTSIRYRRLELVELYLRSPSIVSWSGKGNPYFCSEKFIFGSRNECSCLLTLYPVSIGNNYRSYCILHHHHFEELKSRRLLFVKECIEYVWDTSESSS